LNGRLNENANHVFHSRQFAPHLRFLVGATLRIAALGSQVPLSGVAELLLGILTGDLDAGLRAATLGHLERWHAR